MTSFSPLPFCLIMESLLKERRLHSRARRHLKKSSHAAVNAARTWAKCEFVSHNNFCFCFAANLGNVKLKMNQIQKKINKKHCNYTRLRRSGSGQSKQTVGVMSSAGRGASRPVRFLRPPCDSLAASTEEGEAILKVQQGGEWIVRWG